VTGGEWRFVEHACWVIFEDVILIASCKRGVQEIRAIAERQAEIEATTERVEAAVEQRTEELRESELQKTAVFDNALDGIVCTDAFGEITDINPAAERIFNVTHDQIMGKPLADLFSPGHSRKFVESGLKVYSRSGQGDLVNNSVELSVLSPSGEPFPIEVSMICVLTKDRPVYTAFVRDISQRKRLEENLAHTSKMESLGQLASGVAHEINTPNQYIGDNVRFVDASFGKLSSLIDEYRSAIEGAKLSAEKAEAIAKKEAEADLEFTTREIPSALSQALEGVERVGSIISAMKVFAHPSVESFSEIDLNKIVESSVTVARNEWKYVADVTMDLDQTLPMIQGNRGELSQVVLNLVINSAQAIEERFKGSSKGTITITTRLHDDSVVLTIADNGAGIKPEIADKVFDPFFTTKGVGVGTGQGLAIARTVVDRHSGEIRMKSSIGNGTKFTIKLPMVAPEQEGSCKVA
jgi:PAS domain S-box-containing protein